MLVGAAMNMARDGLLCSVVAEVPFVDVLNTMCDVSLPLTPPEWPEWGNPIEEVEAYDYIQSYAPYEALSSRNYPAVLATAGLTDPRVTYWEPAKWIARLRKLRLDKHGMSLLHTNMGAGHAGKSGRFDRLEEVALVYAFVLYMFHKTASLPNLDMAE
jgi:oligopeptidase B